ncbi:hypothetical protein FW754_07150 [Acinetobacter sp. 1207_04]|uniref:hypothetical protein n=1 Tax=Acinetobacter sp. 1207_04 TaxID=2604449 RepID=UPI0040587AEB
MLFKKTLLVVMCSTVMVACGGGSSSGDSSTSGGNGNVVVPTSDLDKAKQLIDTTKAIISYYDGFEDIADNYKTPVTVINDTALDLSRGTGMVLLLAELALEDAKGQSKSYNADALEALLKQDAINNDYPIEYDLKNNTLNIQVTAGSVQVTGSTDVAYWDGFKDGISWDWSNSQWWINKGNFIYTNQATVNVNNVVIEAPFVSNQKTFNFKIAKGGVIDITNVAKQKAKFSFTEDSTAQLVYAVSNTMNNQETLPTTAALTLKGLVFESADVKATLSEVSSEAKQAQFKNGVETAEQLIPYKLTLKGQVAYLKEVLNLDVTFKLNNDLSKAIDMSAGETSTSFINADLVVKLDGNLKGANAAPTPFSIGITAKRAEYTKGNATVALAVDKNALDIELTATDIDKESPIVSGLIKHKNGAFVQVADVQKFTSADVKVGSTSYGTITKNSSDQYVTKFIDNTITYITP